jgi:hypothetical protein
MRDADAIAFAIALGVNDCDDCAYLHGLACHHSAARMGMKETHYFSARSERMDKREGQCGPQGLHFTPRLQR